MSTADEVHARYHHGNLRASLVAAARELARTEGPEGIVLRAAARSVGVSHNAAYRHFADRDALVAAVADEGAVGLVATMQRRLDGVEVTDPVLRARRRLAEIGRGYVEFALTEPGLFRVLFAAYPDVTERVGAEADPYALLGSTLDDLVDVGFLDGAHREGADVMCWAAVHGFAVLHIDGPLRDQDRATRDADLDHVLVAIDRGYAATTGASIEPGDLGATSTPDTVSR